MAACIINRTDAQVAAIAKTQAELCIAGLMDLGLVELVQGDVLPAGTTNSVTVQTPGGPVTVAPGDTLPADMIGGVWIDDPAEPGGAFYVGVAGANSTTVPDALTGTAEVTTDDGVACSYPTQSFRKCDGTPFAKDDVITEKNTVNVCENDRFFNAIRIDEVALIAAGPNVGISTGAGSMSEWTNTTDCPVTVQVGGGILHSQIDIWGNTVMEHLIDVAYNNGGVIGSVADVGLCHHNVGIFGPNTTDHGYRDDSSNGTWFYQCVEVAPGDTITVTATGEFRFTYSLPEDSFTPASIPGLLGPGYHTSIIGTAGIKA